MEGDIAAGCNNCFICIIFLMALYVIRKIGVTRILQFYQRNGKLILPRWKQDNYPVNYHICPMSVTPHTLTCSAAGGHTIPIRRWAGSHLVEHPPFHSLDFPKASALTAPAWLPPTLPPHPWHARPVSYMGTSLTLSPLKRLTIAPAHIKLCHLPNIHFSILNTQVPNTATSQHPPTG